MPKKSPERPSVRRRRRSCGPPPSDVHVVPTPKLGYDQALVVDVSRTFLSPAERFPSRSESVPSLENGWPLHPHPRSVRGRVANTAQGAPARSGDRRRVLTQQIPGPPGGDNRHRSSGGPGRSAPRRGSSSRPRRSRRRIAHRIADKRPRRGSRCALDSSGSPIAGDWTKGVPNAGWPASVPPVRCWVLDNSG